MAPPPKDEPLLDLDEIQGNVLPGFKKDHQHFVFFSISDAAAARAWLNKLHTRLSSAAVVLDAHRVWKRLKQQGGKEPDAAHFLLLNVALSASGLARLTSKAEVDGFEDSAFKLGQSERSTLIGDPASAKEPGHAAGWLVGGPKHAIDGVLILASDDLTWLEGEQKKLAAELSAQGMKIAHEDRGDVGTAPTRGHEQFGFKDDISRPAVRGRWPSDPYDFVTARTLPGDKAFDPLRADFAAPGSRLIWPGHVIFGYGRQTADDPRTYDAANQAKGPAWAKNGSFMVYRRLRQHTDVFWKFMDDAAKRLARTYPKTAPDKDRLAACVIGRWKSGTPLARSPDKDIGITGDGLNYFSYASKQAPALPGDTAPETADPDGLLCPLGAHIRKVNPRDQATDLGISEHTPPRSIVRRGITYATKDSDKGLLFVAYQSSIVDQFEFLMRMWANKENTPRSNGGLDPILSQNPGRAFYLPIDGKVEKIAINKTFVEPTGGEYFFAPSIGFFKNTLAGVAKKRQAEGEEETEIVPLEVENDDRWQVRAAELGDEILGRDDRARVADTLTLPARWVCAIDLLVDDPKRGKGAPQIESLSRGTGILIGPSHVLTAAHVFDDASLEVDGSIRKVPVAQVRVSPARNGDNTRHPLGAAHSKAFYRPQRFTAENDYALIVLDSDLSKATHKSMKGQLGFWGQSPQVAALRALDPATVADVTVSVIGYPGDGCGNDIIKGDNAKQKEDRIRYCAQRRHDEWASTAWQSSGTAHPRAATGLMLHNADTYEGQSGGPIFLRRGDTLDLLGVHGGVMSTADGGPPTNNRGARVTTQMLGQLRDWINADAGRTWAEVRNDALVFLPDAAAHQPAPASPSTKTRVSNPFAVPFRWMARVTVRTRGSEVSHGSGVLISDVHVLTAAHVVSKAKVSPSEYSVDVTMAQDGSNFLDGLDRIGVSRIDIPSLYRDGHEGFDYALLTLNRRVADGTNKDLGGAKLCYWGSATCGAGTTAEPVDPATLNGQVAITAGYPTDKGGSEMWVVSGTLSRSVGGTVPIHYSGTLIEGQSGSPVWIERNGVRNIVGIAVSRGTNNRIYPLTWEMVTELNGWMLRAEKQPGRRSESEAEAEFAGDQSEGHELEAAGDIVLGDTVEGEFEEGVEPKGLVLLDHVHIPKAPDPAHPGRFTIGASTKLVAADLNPQFYDSAGVLKLDSSPTGLQTCLDAMMKSSFGGFLSRAGQASPHPEDVVHVAVVDLTGAKRSAPEFAAWGAPVDMYGASVPKILALYAAFQLRSDLRDLISRTSPADGKQLEAAAIAEWNAKGYKTDLPDLVWLFDIRKWTPPSALDFTPAARDTFANIAHNCPAGTLIAKVSMPFIGSVAWQSGLYHPMRNGLWLRSSYCDKGTWASPVKSPWVHNVTALSAATYFTLLAQGRLVDTASSTDIMTALRGGCRTRLFPALPVVASKCGWFDGWIHDCAWIQDKDVRYVMAVLSHQTKPAHEALYTQLCAQIDTLVRLNNQTPKASCP